MIPKRIILHHSAIDDGSNVDWRAIRRFHTSYRYDGRIVDKTEAIKLVKEGKQVEAPWSDIGYHFGIEWITDSYEILVGRMMNKMGAHAQGENYDSLGVCFVGNYDNYPVPDAMWHRGILLVRSLIEVFGLSSNDVYGHNQFSTKTCPGKEFDLDAFRSAL